MQNTEWACVCPAWADGRAEAIPSFSDHGVLCWQQLTHATETATGAASCFSLAIFSLPSLIPYSNINYLSSDEGIKINRREAWKRFSFSSHQGCWQTRRGVCGLTPHLSDFLISPLIAVWKPVSSDHFIPLERQSKFSEKQRRRWVCSLCTLTLQSSTSKATSLTERGEGQFGKGAFSASLKSDCRSSGHCFDS